MKPIRYITSLLTFYLKGGISVDRNFVVFKKPNTILGIVPLGAKTERVPINQISSIDSNFRVRFGIILLGLIVVILAAILLAHHLLVPLDIVLIIIYLNVIHAAFDVSLAVNLTSGDTIYIKFFIFDKGKADKAENMLNEITQNRLDDTNVRNQTDRIVDAINKK